MKDYQLGTFEYFCEEACRFREMMGNKKDMLDHNKMLTAWGGLFYVSMRTPVDKQEKVTNILQTIKIELDKRLALTITKATTSITMNKDWVGAKNLLTK